MVGPRQFPRCRRRSQRGTGGNAFRILVSDDAVKAILVNIFGDHSVMLSPRDRNAARKLDMKVPLVVRLEGTNVEQGKQILADSGLALEPAILCGSSRKVVKLQLNPNI